MSDHRLLIVEDESSIREVLQTVLTEEGYEVRAAVHGQEALDVLAHWRPNLILLDLMMPVMDGWTFRERQRQLAGAEAIPVLVLSGAREVRKAAEQLNAIAAIAKPFDLEDLLETIHSLLARINTAPRRGPT